MGFKVFFTILKKNFLKTYSIKGLQKMVLIFFKPRFDKIGVFTLQSYEVI